MAALGKRRSKKKRNGDVPGPDWKTVIELLKLVIWLSWLAFGKGCGPL